MLILFFILLLTEILSIVVLRQHFFKVAKTAYYFFIMFHIILSIWLWILFFTIAGYRSFYDNADHVWLLTCLAGMICAVVLPRIILIISHYTGKAVRLLKWQRTRWLTNFGLVISSIIFFIIATGTLHGRFNIKDEHVTVGIKGLNRNLEGFRIVQISDLHLSCFYHHPEVLAKAVQEINDFNPDIIVNTGDFTTFGWREYGRNDTILSKARSRYGNFAIPGNHDAGTYNPDFTEADIKNNKLNINNLVKSSGYTILNDESTILNINGATIAIIGVTTEGRHPHIIHGDVVKAAAGTDSADLKILLTHDPNHWEASVRGKTDIPLTLSGHTHGMQMGIMTKRFRWSPSKYFYKHWNGLYGDGNQQHYVNRGLGVLAIPFRIWMPPEISVITLKSE
jgi:predicted MPP superfamily phosphohydrolase